MSTFRSYSPLVESLERRCLLAGTPATDIETTSPAVSTGLTADPSRYIQSADIIPLPSVDGARPRHGVVLTWASNPDVEEVSIQRKLRDSAGAIVGLETVRNLPPNGEFTDTTPVPGHEYYYTIVRRSPTSQLPSDVFVLYLPGLASAVDDTGAGTLWSPSSLASYKGHLYFVSQGSSPGLWRSDSTGSGTRLYIPLDPSIGTEPRNLTVVGDSLFFQTGSIEVGEFLWKSDGTVEGTQVVRQLSPPTTIDLVKSFIVESYAAGDRLFMIEDPAGFGETRTLWTSDGTAAGTHPIDSVSMFAGPFLQGLRSYGRVAPVALGTTLYFVGTTEAGGVELWRTDGTAAGTAAVADLAPGAASSSITGLANVNGTIYFGVGGALPGLYATDGTAAGTRRVCDAPSAPILIAGTSQGPLVGRIYFTMEDRSLQYVAASGGTPFGVGGNGGHQLSALGDRVLLATSWYVLAVEATGQLSVLKHFDQAVTEPAIGKRVFQRSGDWIYYIDGGRIYRTDGTAAGTEFVSNGAPRFAEFGGRLADVNGALFFASSGYVDGKNDLWVVASSTPTTPDNVRAVAKAPVAALTASYLPQVGTGATPTTARVAVSWQDRAATETGFYVERSATPDFSDAVSTVWVNANSQTWTDPSAPPLAYYRVASANAAGRSAPSQAVLAEMPASISGRVGQDADGNGSLGTGEPGLAGAQVFLDYNGNGVRDSLDPVATTNSLGNYAFANLSSGGYRIGLVAPAGWSASNNAVIQATVAVAAGQNIVANMLVRRSPSLTLRASADAYVRDGTYAGVNYGGAAEIHVRKGTTAGTSREGFLRFDLSTVGPSAGITSAKVRLSGKLSASMTGGVSIGLFAVSSSTWTESGLKWSNKPATASTAIATRSISSTGATWVEFDVTNYLRQQKSAGAASVNFAIKAMTTVTPWVVVGSDETSANRPQLLVQQASTPVSPPTSPPPTSPPPPATTTGVKVHFRPGSAPSVSGYLADTGAVFGARNGKSYGWSVVHTDAMVDRNANPNQLVDTNVGVKAGAKWELAVANGTYTVKVGIGDAAASSRNNVWIEGVNLYNYVSLSANKFSTKSITVTVTDGKLSLGIGGAATGTTRINFLEVV